MTDTTPPGRKGNRAAELPLIAGILGGWAAQWALGRAWVLDGVLEGYRWPDYLYNAWMVHLGLGRSYDPFRNPLHAALLDALGDAVGSWPDAAVLLASASVAAMVLGAGLAGRALADPWAGGAAALVVPFADPVAAASRWANLYPLLAGTSTLAVGLTAVALRWPGPLTLGLAGLGGGLAWAADPRGVPFGALAAVGIGVALGRARGSRRRRVLGFGMAALGLATGPALEEGFGMAPGRHVGPEVYVEEQRTVVREWMDTQGDEGMKAACAGTPPAAVFTPALLQAPCGAAMVRHNLRYAVRRMVAFPLGWVGLGALLLALPGARGVGASVDGVLIAGGVTAWAALGVVTMPLVERYGLQVAALLTCLAPAGIGRLVASVVPPSRPRLLGLAQAAAAAGLVLLAWSDRPARAQVSATGPSSWTPEMSRWNAAARIVGDLLPPGAAFLDCGAHGVNLALLPRETWPWPPPELWQEGVTDRVAATCLRWITQPNSQPAFVGVAPSFHQGVDSVNYAGWFLATVAESPAWEEAGGNAGYRVYRWRGAP